MFCPIVLQRMPPRTPGVIIYLQGYTLSLARFISLARAPLPSFRFLARGVYPFHPCNFLQGSSLWHFYRYSHHARMGLGVFPAVRPVATGLPWLMVSPGTNTTGISAVRAWTFLTHQDDERDYPDTPVLIITFLFQ